MRMHRKKNLDERIAAASDYLIIMKNESLNYNDAPQEKHLIDTAQWFESDKPLYLEIGGGKGQFACEYARLHPDRNLLCVERNRNVLIVAIDKARELGLTNLRFLCGTAEYLPSYLEEASVEELYLNFSCPFPKHRHEAHRLTNPRFLAIYRRILKPNGAIVQKTDNRQFFEYSLEQLSQFGFQLSNISLDLHHSEIEENIVTEYEQKFAAQGFPIYRLEAR